MTTQQPAQEPPRRPTPIRRTVPALRTEQLTPHMRRITFSGPEMAGFSLEGPAQKMKIYFPLPGQERPVVPDFGVRPSEGQPRPVGRTYTPRRWRSDSLEIDIDFLLHGDGPGATWARDAAPGRLATLSSPTNPYLLDPRIDHYVLAGDGAAVPAIGTILEVLPSSVRADVYIEVDDDAEAQDLASVADVQISWLPREPQAVAGAMLEAALRQARLPEGEFRLWLASEAAAMRRIKRLLLEERRLPREQIYTQGYWKLGEANHSDNDKGDDV